MEKLPMQVVELDSDEAEEMSESHNTEVPTTSQRCEVSSSSSVVPVKSTDAHKSPKRISSPNVISSKTSTGTVRIPHKKNSTNKNVGKISARANMVMRTVPVKILPKPTQLELIKGVVISPGTSSSNNETTKNHMAHRKSQTPKSKQKIYFISPIPSDPNNPISKILLFQPDISVDKPTASKSKAQKTVAKSANHKSKSKQRQKMQLQDKSPIANIPVKTTLKRGRPRKNTVREQRVYLTEVSEPITKNSEKSNTDKKNKTKAENIQITDEEDPLYIPEMQLQEIQPSSLSNIEVSKSSPPPLIRYNRASTPKPSRKASQRSISQSSPTQMTRKQNEMDILTPIVTLTEPTYSEHSVVRNYALLNKVTPKEEDSRVRSKSVPPRQPNKDCTKLVDSDLIYRNKLNTRVLSSDCCRNFFIKNSAWDYLEPVFKGFNEREQNISQSCSDCFSELIPWKNEEKPVETDDTFLTDDDLYYTRKIEVLDKEGKCDRVYYVPPNSQARKKRKSISTYIVPPTKKCKIVLQRDEYVENMLKKYLAMEKLNSMICHNISIPKADANKPLIILNRSNFNVLKVNETLCNHANIIYVKSCEDGFPEKLYKNDFVMSQIEKKIIRLVTPLALKLYFQ